MTESPLARQTYSPESAGEAWGMRRWEPETWGGGGQNALHQLKLPWRWEGGAAQSAPPGPC